MFIHFFEQAPLFSCKINGVSKGRTCLASGSATMAVQFPLGSKIKLS